MLGDVESAAGAPGVAAIDLHSRSLELAEELGIRPQVARCHMGLGALYRRTDAEPKAQEHPRLAVGMFRDMDMPFWVEKAEALSTE